MLTWIAASTTRIRVATRVNELIAKLGTVLTAAAGRDLSDPGQVERIAAEVLPRLRD
jgi:hypothetical protein